MASTSSGDPALADPFYGELRRRRPEARIVLLPPARPGPSAGPSTGLVEARDIEAATRGVLDELLDVTGREPAAVSASWCHQGAGRAHRHVARAVLTGLGSPTSVLRELLAHLADAGWDVVTHDHPRPRLDARRAPVTVRAEAHASAVEVEATSDLVDLDDPVAERLVRAAASGRAARPGQRS